MTKHCINHSRVTYDCCRSCQGKDLDCPEYLESVHTNVHTRKSPRSERDKNVTNGVDLSVELRGTQQPNTSSAHCESYLHTLETKRQVDKGSLSYAVRQPIASQIEQNPESYSRPVQYRRLTIMESQETTRHFLNRFYRSQR